MKFKVLDPLLHSELRLAIMSILISVESADFSFIKDTTNASSGNVSVQIEKLSAAGYISVKKEFEGKYPKTTCKITKKGANAFEEYIEALKSYIDKSSR